MNEFMDIHSDLVRNRNQFPWKSPKLYLLDGFTIGEISCLLCMRSDYLRGRYSETTQEFKRLEFARWLVRHGRLQG